ncbi:hypothetical protein ACTFIW_012889 [Dictyostelium discoideum]
MNYKFGIYKVCPHEDLTFEGAVKLPLRYLEILRVGDTFPLFTQGCTDECKEKLIKITQDREITPSSYLSVVSGCEKKKDFEHGFDFSVELNEDGSFPDYPNTLDS